MAPESNANPINEEGRKRELFEELGLLAEELSKKRLEGDLVKSYLEERSLRKAFFDHLNELTHLGQFTPTKEHPKKAFDEETRNRLVRSLLEDEKGLRSVLNKWFALCDENIPLLEWIKEYRAKAAGTFPHKDLSFPFPSSPSRSDITVPNAERDKRLEELTEFSALQKLFNEDNEVCKEYFKQEPSETADVKKEANALCARKAEIDDRKKELCDKIRELFIIFKGDYLSSVAAKV